jgi:hypothetical protein
MIDIGLCSKEGGRLYWTDEGWPDLSSPLPNISFQVSLFPSVLIFAKMGERENISVFKIILHNPGSNFIHFPPLKILVFNSIFV